MKRSRAFVLVELLTTMLLQAGFILVLCASFYLLASFYSKSQQMLTARDHADRVLLFFEDKMIHAGLGLWKLTTPTDVRNALRDIVNGTNKLNSNSFRLPIAVRNMTGYYDPNNTSELSLLGTKRRGNHITLLYAERDLSSSNILVTRNTALINTDNITLLENTSYTNSELRNTPETNHQSAERTNIRNWAVMESAGVPFFIGDTDLSAQGWGIANNQRIPAGGELLYLRCIQMFVQNKTTDEGGRQFAFRELNDVANWSNKYNQEEGVLEIYMELDTTTNIFTLWVMGTGGFDMTINNPRPANWPENAKPSAANWGKKVNNDEDYTSYPHQIVYVSRASWKLNNLSHFTPASWN